MAGTEQPGEGEFKLFSFLRSRVRKQEPSSNNRFLIVGDDSDLILFSLLAPANAQIHLKRTDTFLDIN